MSIPDLTPKVSKEDTSDRGTRSVSVAPKPVVAAPAPVAPPPVPTTWSTTPIDLSKYGLTQKDVDAASLLVPYSASAAPKSVPIAPPPAVAAPAPAPVAAPAPTIAPTPTTQQAPSYSDWLKTQQSAFTPEPIIQGYGLGNIPIYSTGSSLIPGADNKQYTAYNPTSALKDFASQGGKVGYSEFLNSLPIKDTGYGNPLESGRIGAMQQTEAAQKEWFNVYNPELIKGIGWGDAQNQTGWRIGADNGKTILYRWRKDLGNVTENKVINADGSLGPSYADTYDSGSGIGNIIQAIAPIALGVLAPGVGTAIGSALGGSAVANAVGSALVGAATSAVTGGDPLKGALTAGLGSGLSAGIGSLSSGLDPSITKALQGAAPAVVKGAVTGNFDPKSILAGAATGYLSDPIKTAVKDYIPASGSDTIDNIVRNVALNTPGTLIRGGDLGNLLENTAIGELTKTATGYIPKTGTDFIDKIIGGTATQYATNELRNFFAPQTGAATGALDREQMSVGPRDPVGYAPDPRMVGTYGDSGGGKTAAPVPAAPAPAAQDNSGLVAALLAMGLMDSENQNQTQTEPQVFQAPTLATLPGQLPGQLGGQPTSLAELMALLNTRRA